MSAIKDGRYEVELNGKKYHLLFSLNVLDEVQDKLGGYDKLDAVFNQSNPEMIKQLKWLLTLLINEGKEEDEPELTEKQVGRLIHVGNLADVQAAILKSFAVGSAGDEPAEEREESNEGDEGNRESVQAS